MCVDISVLSIPHLLTRQVNFCRQKSRVSMDLRGSSLKNARYLVAGLIGVKIEYSIYERSNCRLADPRSPYSYATFIKSLSTFIRVLIQNRYLAGTWILSSTVDTQQLIQFLNSLTEMSRCLNIAEAHCWIIVLLLTCEFSDIWVQKS